MDAIQELWAVWYVGSDNKLLYIEGKGTLEECVLYVEPRQHGSYAILPFDPLI